MGWNPRLCRACGTRFVPGRLEERLCRACASDAGGLPQVVEYLHRHHDASLTRVALATGVSEDAIRRFAREGVLPCVPQGAEPEPACTCPSGRHGVCPSCREQLAAQISSAGLNVAAPRPVSRMRTRDR